ncbi:MAG: hypothetical protein JNL21_39380 [Myxococcales bacterium]|jgi:hypothetical protein|nr:hypothetical protein [Myxococcales bacterium]
MLNDQQIDALADKLNAKLDIPLAGEGTEKQILTTALQQLNKVLAGQLGEELRATIGPLVDGSASGEEAARLRTQAVDLLNKKVNLPVVGEETEAKLLGPVVDGIVDVLRKNVG